MLAFQQRHASESWRCVSYMAYARDSSQTTQSRRVQTVTIGRATHMLQDRLRLVLLDALGHHVEDVVHDGGAELEVEVRLDALLGDRLGDALGVPALELTGEQVAEPALEQRDDAAQEEEPDTPARRPEADAGPLADRVGVETRVDDCGVSTGDLSADGPCLRSLVIRTCRMSLYL